MKFRLCIVFLRHGSGAQPHLISQVAFELYHTQAQKAHFLVRRKALCSGGFGQIVRHGAVILTGAGEHPGVHLEAAQSARLNGFGRIAPGFAQANGNKTASDSSIHFYRFAAARINLEIVLKVLR
ncbi:hypothetical protein [Paraburkholderia phytofirmans]|uniref:Uncharacterized protein n=1 Tax=Paraburkholderia phytofirmans TaxID=261302 RepID=A0ABW9BGA9_9BURK|nr:hypothetical protein [Paraburkholderia phytofirmans]